LEIKQPAGAAQRMASNVASRQHTRIVRIADIDRASGAIELFEAIGQYLNDRLREPEWQAQLIQP